MAAARTDTVEISNAVQDYAKAIWSIGQRTGAPVSTSAISERLDVSPASASAMVKRLEEKLEHAISPELSELIAAKLGNPTHDPHGDPIPTRDGEIDDAPTRALADLRPGERGVFSRVSDSNPDMLRYLSERGIAPGDELELAGREPFGGPLTVRANGREHALGDQLARAMRVEPSK
jgi:DtxR family Mn-dependent transcriptional regulator